MKKTTMIVCSIGLFLGFSLALPKFLGTQGMEVRSTVNSGILTLYARDPLATSFCFTDGHHGRVFQNHEVRNRCSDVDFNSYYTGNFTVGIEGGKKGTIIDLGLPDEMQQKYSYRETVGKGQGFASIQLKDGKVFILQDQKTKTLQELKEAAPLFEPSTKQSAAPVQLGHVYLVRITDADNKALERVAKLLVIAYTPNESVTVRWQIL